MDEIGASLLDGFHLGTQTRKVSGEYRSGDADWIPASFVLSRIRRLMPETREVRVLRSGLRDAGAEPAAAAGTA